MDCSPPGSSVHGILQARILEWVAISFSRGSSCTRDRTWVSCTAGRFFTTEPPGKPNIYKYICKHVCTCKHICTIYTCLMHTPTYTNTQICIQYKHTYYIYVCMYLYVCTHATNICMHIEHTHMTHRFYIHIYIYIF